MAERNKNWKQWIMPAVLLISLVTSFALYWGTLHGDFVVDDALFNQRDDYRQASHLLKVWDEPYLDPNTAIYRPLASFTFVANYVIFGDGTTSFHVFNLILNAIAVWLVFYLVYKLFKNYLLSLFATLFFAFQPFHRIPAGNIKNRDETLAAIFTILTVLAFMKARDWLTSHPEHKKKIYARMWMAISAVCAFLSLASKEMAVVTPVVVLGVYWLQERPKLKDLFIAGLWYVPLTLLFLWMRWHVLGPYMLANDSYGAGYSKIYIGDAPFLTGIWTAGSIAFVYLTKMFIPYDLTMDYTYNQLPMVTNILHSWQAIVGYCMLGGIMALLFLKKEKYRPVVYGAALFLITYFFVSKILIKYGGQIAEENWMYLPSLGISIIVGYVLVWLYNRKKAVAIIALVIMLVWYGYVDIKSNQMWLDAYHIALDRVAQSPNSADAHYVLALSYLNMNDAIDGKKELVKADAIYPIPDVQDLYGQLAMRQGNYQEAADYFKAALNENGDANVTLHYDAALVKLGRYQEAIDLLTPWYNIDPEFPQLRFAFALAYYKMGKIDVAKTYLDPNSAESLDDQLKDLASW